MNGFFCLFHLTVRQDFPHNQQVQMQFGAGPVDVLQSTCIYWRMTLVNNHTQCLLVSQVYTNLLTFSTFFVLKPIHKMSSRTILMISEYLFFFKKESFWVVNSSITSSNSHFSFSRKEIWSFKLWRHDCELNVSLFHFFVLYFQMGHKFSKFQGSFQSLVKTFIHLTLHSPPLKHWF